MGTAEIIFMKRWLKGESSRPPPVRSHNRAYEKSEPTERGQKENLAVIKGEIH